MSKKTKASNTLLVKCGHCGTTCKESKLVKIVVARVRCDQLGEDEYTVEAGQLLNMLPDSEFDQDEVISGILSMENVKVEVNRIPKALSKVNLIPHLPPTISNRCTPITYNTATSTIIAAINGNRSLAYASSSNHQL